MDAEIEVDYTRVDVDDESEDSVAVANLFKPSPSKPAREKRAPEKSVKAMAVQENAVHDKAVALKAVAEPHVESPRRLKYRYVLSAKDDDFILKAIEEHKTLAFMAQQIGCCRQALADYIHKNRILQQAFTDAQDGMDDLAELRLFEKINQGDLGAIMFYMPRKMRHRGYGDQPVVEQGAEVPRVVIGKIADDELEEADRLLESLPAPGANATDESAESEETSEPSRKTEEEDPVEPSVVEPSDDAEVSEDYDDTELSDPLFG